MSKKIGKTVPKCSVTSRREFPAMAESVSSNQMSNVQIFDTLMTALGYKKESVDDEQMGESND